MNSHRPGVAHHGEKEDFSFFEALTFESKEPPLNIKDLGLPPTPRTPVTSTPRVPEKHHNNQLQRTVTASKTPTKSTKPNPPTTMAPTKAQVQCLETCHKTTSSIDLISIHILEYLSTAKQVQYGFEPLAHDFLDTCQILFSIEAGLGECNRTGQRLPQDMLVELEHKFRVAQADFNLLNQMLVKLIAPSSRIARGWGKLFGDTDVKKMAIALSKTRESLRQSSSVFQWNVGSQATEKEKGIGYTGLAAALDRMDHKAGTSERYAVRTNGNHAPAQTEREAPAQQQPQGQSQSPGSSFPAPPPQLPPALPFGAIDAQNGFQQYQQSPAAGDHLNGYHSHQHQHQLQQPSIPWSARTSSVQHEGSLGRASGNEMRQPLSAALRPSASVPGSLGHDLRTPLTPHIQSSARSSTAESFDRFEHHSAMDDARSLTTITEPDPYRDHDDLVALDLDPSKIVRISADPSTMPRLYPRNAAEGDTNMRGALVAAVRGKNHKLIEQLLHRGVPASTALKEAILAHDDESVRLLLLFGADPNDPDRDGITPLYAAVETSFLAGATSLLKYGADPNLAAGPELESPLAVAVAANSLGFSHLLLTYGGDAKHMTATGLPLLTCAIKKKTPKKFMDLLLDYGLEPNTKTTDGRTALFEAIQLGRADIVTSLLDHGADPNLPGPKHMLWPSVFQPSCLQVILARGADHKKAPGLMELAVSLNNIESVRILLKAGVNPDLKKDGTYTPLCTAIRDDRADLLKLLLANGAGPNVMASEYPAFKCVTHNRLHFLPALVAAGANLNSPKGIIETAVSFDNMKALTWLLDQGVNPNDRNPKGQSPLTTAIRENRIEMLDVLLVHGADPHMRGEDWPVCMAVRNPKILKRVLEVVSQPQAFKGIMEMAVSANQLESVKLLIAAGVSVEDKNGGVFSPLTTAIREDRREIVTFLLDHGGVDVNAPGEHLPVVKALRRYHGEGDTEIMETLLNHGADPNKMYRGWNGFMQAVENGDADILRILTRHTRVDLEVKDDMGRTVAEMAESRGWDEAVQILTGEDGSSKARK